MNEIVEIPNTATPLEMRQAEVDMYTSNISLYNTILSTLDGNWDADLIHLKGIEPHESAKSCPMDRIERLAELQNYDQVSQLIKTEIIERSKANAILNVLKSQALG